MPFNFLFGTAVLGTKAILDIKKAQDDKLHNELHEKHRKEIAQKEKDRFAPLPDPLLQKYIEFLNECRNNCEVPNAYMKGGTLWLCEDASSIEEVIETARNHRVSYVDPQPRWRLARVSDFQRKSSHYKGAGKAAYYNTLFYYNSNNIPLNNDIKQLFSEFVEKYRHELGFVAFNGTYYLPDCIKDRFE